LANRERAIAAPSAAIMGSAAANNINGKTDSRRAHVLALVAVVVGVDVLFFRNRFWERD
jgi:hypothetical protein